jgi:hypothetical protein
VKKVIILVTIAVSTLMNSAFAIHAYRTQVCKSNKFDAAYSGYLIGDYYSLSKNVDSNPIRAILKDDVDMFEEADLKSNIYFTESNYKQLGKVKRSAGDCFEHESKSFKITRTFQNVSYKNQLLLGINNGQSIDFICEETISIPENTKCPGNE